MYIPKEIIIGVLFYILGFISPIALATYAQKHKDK